MNEIISQHFDRCVSAVDSYTHEDATSLNTLEYQGTSQLLYKPGAFLSCSFNKFGRLNVSLFPNSDKFQNYSGCQFWLTEVLQKYDTAGATQVPENSKRIQITQIF
ncbi:hypothetical protein EG68_04055 [Paragonimus skrjabini miyazakii]|uniref:Uncharacterized protein n=1 Tax=Paragonimus skrjabini miyazakii TaxID=59628 RepID=A0A8S9YZV7_9TREM|nr:hypothetical protein EG68_04055 [Paragonimus skrjabini miyazakii]